MLIIFTSFHLGKLDKNRLTNSNFSINEGLKMQIFFPEIFSSGQKRQLNLSCSCRQLDMSASSVQSGLIISNWKPVICLNTFWLLNSKRMKSPSHFEPSWSAKKSYDLFLTSSIWKVSLLVLDPGIRGEAFYLKPNVWLKSDIWFFIDVILKYCNAGQNIHLLDLSCTSR